MKALTDLLKRCTVKLTVPGKGHGTGFFVAPGHILTCGHVVSIGDEPVRDPIKVRWGQDDDFAEARVVPDHWSRNPDVALLEFTDPKTDHPCVFLGEDVRWTDDLHAFGYPDLDFENGSPVGLKCEGDTGDVPPLIKFNLGLIRPGMSGSPILNARTGKVCGMVKFTLGKGDVLGGGGVPASAILGRLDEIGGLQKAFHKKDPRWAEAMASAEGGGFSKDAPHNIPSRLIDNFVGRKADMEKVHAMLQADGRAVIAAVQGMGGVGKTELALQYAVAQAERSTYPGGILWIDARREDAGVQIVNFARIKFGLEPPEDLDAAGQAGFCWSRWPRKNALVVFDDVADYPATAPFFPPQPSHFKVLITTRLMLDLPQCLSLDALDEPDALDVLGGWIGPERISRERADAESLCRRLGGLPLALNLVGAYLKNRRIPLKEMLERLQEKGLSHKALDRDKNSRNWTLNIERGVRAAFELNWDELSGDARRLGCRLGLFAAAPIPWELMGRVTKRKSARRPSRWFTLLFPWRLTKRVMKNKDRESVEDAIVELKALHLIDAEASACRIHQLVRDFFRLKLDESERAEAVKADFAAAIAAEAKDMPQICTRDDISRRGPAIPHIIEAADALYDHLAANDLIWPCSGVGRFYENQGFYAQAEPWRLKALHLAESRFLSDHPYVAVSLENLATLHHHQGRHEEALPLFKRALEIYEKSLGPGDPNVATCLNNLATLHSDQGRYEDALLLYKRALEIKEKSLGPDHPKVAQSLNNLAVLHYNLGRYERALTLFKRALEIREKILGLDHLDVAESLNNLAEMHTKHGCYEDALLLYKRALEIREKSLGPDHPGVANILSNLAALHYIQGRYEGTLTLFKRALKIREKSLGLDHPDVAVNLNNLAEMYRNQGCYEDALPFFQRALEIWEKVLGPDHPRVATSLNNLAVLHNNQGRYEDALPLHQRALEIREKALGPDHPDVATSLNNLAALHYNQGRYEDALPLLSRALEIREKAFGPDHPDTKLVKKNLENLRTNLP